MGPLGGNHLGHSIAEVGRAERLCHEVVGATLLGLHSHLRLGMSSEDEHFRVTGGIVGAKPPQHLPPVHPGKPDVEHDRCGKDLACRLESGYAVGSADDIQAEFAKADLDEATHACRVFNDQDGVCHLVSIGRLCPYCRTFSLKTLDYAGLLHSPRCGNGECRFRGVAFKEKPANRCRLSTGERCRKWTRSSPGEQRKSPMEPFRVEPYSDFSEPGSRDAYQEAIDTVLSKLGGHVPLIINGKPVATDERIVSINPARPDVVVGTTGSASRAEAQLALDAATEAFAGWSRRPALERAEIIHRIGDLIAERKYDFSAWMTLEAGKNWVEAEADVAEAIDFCRYYAHEAIRMGEPVPVLEYPGEKNESFLLPIGVGVVIPPWNFPLAILVGMTMGPVAAGNTVVLKPASNTPLLGAHLMDIVAEAGLPDGVINFLPGPGADVGDFLVDHPATRFINFTGSKEVGLRIAQRSAAVHPEQQWMKRAFMEMGGKDGIVVDETADLDLAADSIVRSAYGYQGQKCSACSRAIVVDAVHDELLDRIVAMASALEMGPPIENKAVGPVISAEQHSAILAEIDRGKNEAQLVLGGQPVDMDGGYYIAPTIFSGVAPHHRLAQHEIFGPVLSVIRVADFDAALDVANGTEYGLTGGLVSSDPDRIARAKREFYVGNLYINRKITGALVGIQPFGGFKMSGSNAKAGGPDYLRLFMEMKTVAEKL